MIGHSYKTAITIAIALVFILALVGSASAGNAVQVKIKGNGKLVDGARIFETDNDAVAERTLQVTLNGPGKLAFFDAGTVHAENTDGSIVADVNVSKIQVSGKSTGTGTVEANATVRAEGHNILDGTGAVIGVDAESAVIAFVDLDAGAKGTAEGTAFASGTATATGVTLAGSSVDTSATGTASASGKVTSTNPSQLHAEGRISGIAGVLDDGLIDPESIISARVFGHDASQGAVGASGEASAIGTNIDGVTVDTSVEGATSASGSSAKGGMFNAMSATSAFGLYFPGLMNITDSSVWADAFSEGSTNTGKAAAAAAASGEAESDIQGIDPASFHTEVEDAAVSASTSAAGDGFASASSDVRARASDLDFFFIMNTPLDDPAAIGFDISGDAVDASYITSQAGAFGDNSIFKGSAASAATAGEVEAAVALDDVNFTNTFATGATAASASAAKTADAAAGSAIISVNVINSTDSVFLLFHPVDENTQPVITQTDGRQPILLIGEPIDLPDSSLADASVIADFAWANGETSMDIASASSSAKGMTTADGSVGVVEMTDEAATSYSIASGAVSARTSASAKTDPFAASIIGSVSIPGLGDNTLVDASLIASIAEAEGSSGTASATAAGFTAANGTIEFVLEPKALAVELKSSTLATGAANASATANNGFGLAVSNIASFNLDSFGFDETTGTVTDADLVDVSLIGGVSTADDRASAKTTAAGFTVSDGTFSELVPATGAAGFLIEDANVTGHSDATAPANTSVTAFGGFGLAAAGVGSVSVVDWDAGTPPDDIAAVPPSATLVDVSLIGDLVVADGFGPKDTATATASASGATSANGVVNDTSFDDLAFNMAGDSFAAGEVSGKVVANQVSDPISLSAILSVNTAEVDNTFDSIAGTIDTTKTFVDVSTVTSASLATGKNGVATGEAEGFTDAGSSVSLNTTVDTVNLTTLISSTFAAGEASASANATSPDALSLAVAGQTAVDVVVDESSAPAITAIGSAPLAVEIVSLLPQVPEEFGMLLGHGSDEIGRLSGAVKQSGLLGTDDMISEEFAASGLTFPIDGSASLTGAAVHAADPMLVGVSAGGAAAFSSGTGSAAGMSEGASSSNGHIEDVIAGTTDLVLNSDTFTAETSSAKAKTFKGLALAASGAASVDVVTYEAPFGDDILPTANIVDVSVIGDIAFATGNEKSSSAKADASAAGFTTADGLVDDDESHSASRTEATGTASGLAEAKSISDPLTASLIGSVEVVDVNPVNITTLTDEIEDVTSVSIIASASFAADDSAKASGKASGMTDANSRMDIEWADLVAANLTSGTMATGSAASDISVKNGFGVGVSVIGSVSNVDFEPLAFTADVDDTSFMATYAAGEGTQVTSGATTTDAMTTSSGTFTDEFTDTGQVLLDLNSTTATGGSGNSNIQVSGGNAAEALSFAFSNQEDTADSIGQDSMAIAAFGVELDGTDGAPVTSTASLSDVQLLADATQDNFNGIAGAHTEFVGVEAFARLKPQKNEATLMVADSVPVLSYVPAGGADVDQDALLVDTLSNPNMVSYTRYGEAVSDENNLFNPDLQFLPIIFL